MKQSMRKVILFCIGFCVLLVFICLPFYFVRQKGYQYIDVQHKVEQLEELPNHTIDVLFLGDSQVWASLSPRYLYKEFGIVSYNGGTPGQWTYDGKVILDETLKKQNLKAVVLEASEIFSYPNKYKFLLSQIMPIFHYHGIGRRSDMATGDEHSLGANLSDVVAPYAGGTSYMDIDYPAKEIASHSLKYLNEIVTFCKEKNIKVLFMASPSPLTWNRGKQKAVNTYSKEKNIPFIDYNEPSKQKELGIDFMCDTRDGGDHLNNSGARKVTNSVGQWLKENVKLKDYRGDKRYHRWKGSN